MKWPAYFVPLMLAAAALGQDDARPSPYDDAKVAAQKRITAERQAAAGNPDRHVWDFVIADRKTKTVTLLACASQIKPTDLVEFFVTPTISGKDYEALAVTFATPADLRAAMEFVGVTPGWPIMPDENRYWPRGPRVLMTFKAGGGAPLRAEALVLDTTTGRPLPGAGLVYTGSYRYTDKEGVTHFAADESDARPIAATYNDPAALFDLPAQAGQSEVYGFRKPSPAFAVKPGEAIDITLSEATGTDAVLVRYAVLNAGVVDGKVRYGFAGGAGQAAHQDALLRFDDLPHLLAAIGDLADGTMDLFTDVRIGPGVPVTDVRNLYAVLQAVEKDRGFKFDPLSKTHLFYRSFFPQPEWRDRATRLGEPWELFLTRDVGKKVVAKLERSVDNPDRKAVEPKTVESSTPADPAAFAAHLTEHASRWSRTIFVYPPADLTYGELMEWVRPVMAAYPRVFVFPAG